MGLKKGWKKTQDTVNEHNLCRYCWHPLSDHIPDTPNKRIGDRVRKDMKTGRILCRFPNTLEGKEQANLGLYKSRLDKRVKADLDEYQRLEDRLDLR